MLQIFRLTSAKSFRQLFNWWPLHIIFFLPVVESFTRLPVFHVPSQSLQSALERLFKHIWTISPVLQFFSLIFFLVELLQWGTSLAASKLWCCIEPYFFAEHKTRQRSSFNCCKVIWVKCINNTLFHLPFAICIQWKLAMVHEQRKKEWK